MLITEKKLEVRRRLECATARYSYHKIQTGEINSLESWMRELGLCNNDFFFSIFSDYRFGDLDRAKDAIEFIQYPDEIIDTTNYIWSEWGMSRDFIALDTIEGQGSTAYSIKTGAVYTFSSWDVEKLNNYEIEPSWQTIEDFLLHFLPENLPNKFGKGG